MVVDVVETKRLIMRKFGYDRYGNKLSDSQRKEEAKRIFMSWSNPQNYRYNEITWDIDSVDKMFDYQMPTSWGMYYMIAEDKETGEIIATCRFGQYYNDDTNTVWDFGYNVFRSDDKEEYTLEDIKSVFLNNGLKKDELYWGRGYAKEMLTQIMEFAIQEGIKKLHSGADIDNFGSIKAMIKNGFTFSCIDDYGDPCMEYDLANFNKLELSSKDIVQRWDEYLSIINSKRNDYITLINDNYNDQYSKAIAYHFLAGLAKHSDSLYVKTELEKLSYNEKKMVLDTIRKLNLGWKNRLKKNKDDEELNRHVNLSEKFLSLIDEKSMTIN